MRRWFDEQVRTLPAAEREQFAAVLGVDAIEDSDVERLREQAAMLGEQPDERDDQPPRCAVHQTTIHEESVPIAGDTVVVQRCETDPCLVNALADLAIDRERYLAGREPEYRETRQLVDAERLRSERQVKESVPGDDANE
ncbi:hypothetical protein [Haloarchaeobius sp. TZWSO28]|uniref:hypothetical protein n=1 Tax=Haloarchaeobius sp. TZWSO28 TaxID=3446119 RepID=UPI003EB925BA